MFWKKYYYFVAWVKNLLLYKSCPTFSDQEVIKSWVLMTCLYEKLNPDHSWEMKGRSSCFTWSQYESAWIGVVLTFGCFRCRGESYPDKQESQETKSKRGPEGIESSYCIFAWVILFLDSDSQSTSVMSLCCRPSLTSDEGQRVLRWACLI